PQSEVASVQDAWAAVGVGAPSVGPYGGGGVGSEVSLTNGKPIDGIIDNTGHQQYWKLYVPSGQSKVVFTISGGTGDADLYVKLGSDPTLTSYDCRPRLAGNQESCTISPVASGWYYVMLNGYTSYSNVSLV